MLVLANIRMNVSIIVVTKGVVVHTIVSAMLMNFLSVIVAMSLAYSTAFSARGLKRRAPP